MPKKKDALIIAAVIAAAVILFAASRFMPKTNLEEKTADVTMAPDAVEYLDETPAPTDAPAAEAAEEAAFVGPMPPAKEEKVRGHVIITVNGRQYGEPIPMDRDKIITVKQDDGKINKVHITPEEVWMEYSTCENQDCVDQGVINVDTY